MNFAISPSHLIHTAKNFFQKNKATNNQQDLMEMGRKAVSLTTLGKLQEAEAIYREMIAIGSTHHAVFGNLAAVCGMQGRPEEVIELLNKAIELKPDYPDAYNNLGIALQEQGELTKAIASFDKAIELKPDYPEAYSNLGVALQEQGELTRAIASFNKAITLKPDYQEAHYNYGFALLLTENYRNGWEKYEWRFKTEKPSLPHANPICPRLDNNGLSKINKLLIISEQGLGDTLHFMRYIIAIQQRGIQTSLCAQPKLHSLIQASGIDSSPLTPEQGNQVSEGQWIPLLSAPRLLEVSPSNPIITTPYIKTTDELNEKWRTIFSENLMPTIGINWRGNRDDSKRQGRNISSHIFRKIVQNYTANFVCLQREAKASEIEEITLNPKTTPHQLNILRIADSENPEDFLEYAAIIKNCDLVITTASTVAHIAAGLGIPTWVLLARVPDWRWGLEGDSTFWYPSMRLFRQSENDNWDEVIQRVTLALQEQFANNLLDG